MRPNRKKRFTLVELIVVIVIIMILVGIALPVYVVVMRKARITQTKARIASLQTAIIGYKGQFGYLPFYIQQGNTDYKFQIDGNFIGMLCGANSRGIRFLTLESTTFPDAWGSDFWVALDLDGNDEIGIIPGEGTIKCTVAVWSLGPDKQDGTTALNKDNVVSWKK